MNEDSAVLKAKSDALRLLSFRPRSVEELRNRLKLKKYPEEVIQSTLESLERQGLLNDEKFAKLFSHASVYTRPTGRRKLEFDLKKKGLALSIIEKTLSSLEDYDEKKVAHDLVATRFHKMTGISKEKKKARLYGFLQRRGFSSEAIFGALSELFSESEIDDNG